MDFQLGVSPEFSLLAIGDSKTAGETCCTATNGYRDALVANLEATANWSTVGFVGAYALGGGTTANIASGIDAYLASLIDAWINPDFVLVNVGSNDINSIGGSLDESAWQASADYILSAVHTRFPSAQIGLACPIVLDNSTGTNTFCGWVTTAIASHSAYTFAGPDERAFLPGHLSDNTHPDASGYALTAAAWQAAMGY